MDYATQLAQRLIGRRDAVVHVTYKDYTQELPMWFINMCDYHNIQIKLVDDADKRRNTIVQL